VTPWSAVESSEVCGELEINVNPMKWHKFILAGFDQALI
jgi:hypothetical protein